jgi:hypothetical protein
MASLKGRRTSVLFNPMPSREPARYFINFVLCILSRLSSFCS